MKKIIFLLALYLTMVMPKNFAMMYEPTSDEKYQQMFRYDIEVPLIVSKFSTLLNFWDFVKTKKTLCVLDSDQQDISFIKAAILAVNNAKRLMEYKIMELKFWSQNSEETKRLFNEIYLNLDAISNNLYEDLKKVLSQ
jgi:hypothetical protein